MLELKLNLLRSFAGVFLSLLIVLFAPKIEAFLRYTEQSCIDLTPRTYDDYTHAESYTSLDSSTSRKRRSNDYGEEIPFKMTAKGKRYRRDADVVVQIEGGAFDGLMLQARSLGGNSREYQSVNKKSGGGIGLIGQFRYLRFPFKHLTCFDSPASTVIDDGKPVKLGNISFIWRAPDQDVGDMRFVASILRGIQYWIIVSNTLVFNPFPISSYSCGSTLACFRVCPYDQQTCVPRDAVFVFTYHVNVERLEIEFTLGGRLYQNNSYLAVAFGEDFDNLRQAEMMACWMDRGRAKVEHLLIDSLFLPPYSHSETIEVDDYDLHLDESGYDKLWCRFRRSINPSLPNHFSVKQPLYHFHFWGNVDFYFHRFTLPKTRNEIYTSAYKRNFSHSVNEIVSGSEKLGISWMALEATISIIVSSRIMSS